MISEKLVKAINDQIIAELWSSNLYLQMAFFLKKEGWNGSAHWMLKQSAEEKDHALALADYVIKRGGEANVGMIDVVPDGWGSLLDVFQNVYEHECHVSGLVNDLVDLASAERDKATQDFLWGFVREQVEEEDSALTIVERLKRAGEAERSSLTPSLRRDSAFYDENFRKGLTGIPAGPFLLCHDILPKCKAKFCFLGSKWINLRD